MLDYQEAVCFVEFVLCASTIISTIVLFLLSLLLIFKCITTEQYKTIVTRTQLTEITMHKYHSQYY